MITGGDLRQSRLDVGYKTFTISPCSDLAFDYVLISPVDVLHAWAVIQKMLNYAPK